MTTTVRKVAEGAYFVKSYSEQTVLPFSGMMVNQTVTTKEVGEELIEPIEDIKEDIFTKSEFEKALQKVSHRIKK